MGCDMTKDNVQAASAADRLGKKSTLRIYGDNFSSDTRALLAVCKYADITHEYVIIDTLAKENEGEHYTSINPTGHIPMLTKGFNQVIAPGFVLFEWILKTNESAAQAFCHNGQ